MQIKFMASKRSRSRGGKWSLDNKRRCVKAAPTAHWEFNPTDGTWESCYWLKSRELAYLYLRFHQSWIEVAPGDIIPVSLSLFHDKHQASLADKRGLPTTSLSVLEY